MRIVSLLRIAAEAEVLRLRAAAERQGRRAALGAGALVFALGVLCLAEIAGWQALTLYVIAIHATLILLGVNFVIAAILGLLAARGGPSHAEQEALRLRRQALEAARGSLAFTAAVPAATTLLRLTRRQGSGAGSGGSWLRVLNR